MALFQLKNNHFRYIKAVLSYRLRHKIEFPQTTVRLKGTKFLTRENSMDIAHLSFFYERETTNFLLNLKPKTFLDIGAHIGRFSVLLAKNGSRVISIEPSRRNFAQLNGNIQLNRLQDNIVTINVGCSDRNGKKIFYFSPINEGSSSLRKNDESIPEITQIQELDNIYKDFNINPKEIDVIKVDVEGFELNVLKGSQGILKKSSPLLIVEILDKKNEEKIRNFLRKLGYSCKKILDSRNFIFTKNL